MSELEQLRINEITELPMPATLLEEFFNGRIEKELLQGLEIMFTAYFKENRFFDGQKTAKVLESYHFCSYLLENKNLFNPQSQIA